jgi:cell shape-determining protein MreD
VVFRILLFILLGFITAFCLTILANVTSILGIAPDYGMIIILLVVLREDYLIAFPAVLMVALIVDALNPETFGFGAFIRFGLAVIVYELKQQMNLEMLSSRIYALIGAEFIFQFLYQLIAQSFDIGTVGQIYLESSLPTLAYTTAVGFLIFFILDLDIKIDIRRRRVD